MLVQSLNYIQIQCQVLQLQLICVTCPDAYCSVHIRKVAHLDTTKLRDRFSVIFSEI